MKIIEVISIGDDLGFIPPEEFVEKLHADKNDVVGYIEIPNGIKLVPYIPESSEQIVKNKTEK
jgi:hypothetical protein